jgi:hypothetical protein
LEATRLHDASQTAKRDELLAATRPYEASELVGPDEKLKAARPDGKPKAEITDGLSVAARPYNSRATRPHETLEAARLPVAARPDGASETVRRDELSDAARLHEVSETARPDEAWRLPEAARPDTASEAARPDGMAKMAKRDELSAAARHYQAPEATKSDEESVAARPDADDSDASKSARRNEACEATRSDETSEVTRPGEASEVARPDEGTSETASSHEASGATRPDETSALLGEGGASEEVADQYETSVAKRPGDKSEAAWLGEALEAVIYDPCPLKKTRSLCDGGKRDSGEGEVAKGVAEYRDVGIRVSDGTDQVGVTSGCDRLGIDIGAQDRGSCADRAARDTHRGDSEETTTHRAEGKCDRTMYRTLTSRLPCLRHCSLRVLSAPSSRVFMAFLKDGPGGDLMVQPSATISLVWTAALDYVVLLSLFCQLFLLNCNLLKSNLFGTFLKEQAVAFPPPHRQSRRIIASNRVLNNCITLNILHSGLQRDGTEDQTDSGSKVECNQIAQQHELLYCRMRNFLFLKNYGSTSLYFLHQLSQISFFVLGSPAHEGARHE